jgi:oligopeptide/dipeptide ABC transporter ATP-binding protein
MMTVNQENPILSVRGLTKVFPVNSSFFSREKQVVRAVSDVSFDLKRGETLGLVGESGCGKSTLGRCILRLIEPTSGDVLFNGRNLRELNSQQMREMRRSMQIIFQDPYASLNPRMTVQELLMEPLEIHGLRPGREARMKRVYELLDLVGLRRDAISRYPHEFSGGQRQRICIARALAVEPEFLVCDEPVSALDVSIQAQIINLLQDLQKEFGLSYLFIAHDLKVVEHLSNRVAVMYLGRIAEIATSEDLYNSPQHPYTQALLSAIPVPDPTIKKERIILQGDVPSPISPPSGCTFHPRCPKAVESCKQERPLLQTRGEGASPEHLTACLRVE